MEMERSMERHTSFKPGGVVGWALNVWRARAAAEGRRKERGLQVRETLALGGRRQLALVTCGDREFLVGMGADTVDSIVPLAQPVLVEMPRRAHWNGGF